MPFYIGNDPSIIPVYESSYQFQGYITQGLNKFYSEDIDYYIFIGDDVLLAPWINENNILEILRLKKNSCYISEMDKLNSSSAINWGHSKHYAKAFISGAVNWKPELPEYRIALNKFREFFGAYSEEFDDEFFDNNNSEKEKFIRLNRGTYIQYPLACAYSDFFVLPKLYIKKCAHLFGIFASMNLFVEMAIPSTIILVCEKNDVITSENISYREELFWTEEERIGFAKECNYSIKNLFQNYNEQVLLYHPVKLSQWTL